MKQENIQSFYLVGLAIRTTNENGQSSTDIPALWGRFMAQGIINQIPNKLSNAIYCVYTEYEKDHTRPYTTLLGCKVSDLNNVPPEMKGICVEAGNYQKMTAKGNINEGIVFNEWLKIWSSDLPRAFTADFEVYDERTHDPENAEIDIFVAVK